MRRVLAVLAVLAVSLALASCGTRTEGANVPPPERGTPEGSPRERNLADSVEGEGPTTNRNLGVQQPGGREQRVYQPVPGSRGTGAVREGGGVPPGGTGRARDLPSP